MKIIHRDLLRYSDAIARFVEEAQACAQLEHSGIVPVHDVGQLPDGRYFYTMKEVRGRDLGHVIAKVHTASRMAFGGRMNQVGPFENCPGFRDNLTLDGICALKRRHSSRLEAW